VLALCSQWGVLVALLWLRNEREGPDSQLLVAVGACPPHHPQGYAGSGTSDYSHSPGFLNWWVSCVCVCVVVCNSATRNQVALVKQAGSPGDHMLA
jgi:hypothetical protein